MSTSTVLSPSPTHNQRAAFAERLHKASYLEYWEADYRTDKPITGVVPFLWSWEEMRGLMLESERLIGINEAERRGLILANPGLGGKPYMTNTIFGDVQILAPGEKAPAHRHTTSASRLFFEGNGAYTTVEGEKCTMGPGDLVINPSWAWHDHGNEGDTDATYLNILDVPLVTGLGCTFYDHEYWKMGDTSKTIQSVKNKNRSFDFYATGGIMPKAGDRTPKPYSPQLVYRFDEVRSALERLIQYEPDPYDGHIIEYINPASGESVMPTMSFTMQLLSPGQKTQRHRHTSSTVYCAVEGEGYTQVEDTRLTWKKHDVFVVPTWAWHSHVNNNPDAPAMLFSVSDQAATSRLGLYREEGELPNGEIVSIVQPK
jgi:gentisate 1,2-dioxygenase